MRQYLSKSISSLNQNKLNGVLAEIDLRYTLGQLGFADKISQGGWIVRNEGRGLFGHQTIVFFPQTIKPDIEYPGGRSFEEPARGLHTICSTMHQIGIHSYYCVPVISENPLLVKWYATQLGIPTQDTYNEFPELLTGSNFQQRSRRYNFLRNKSESSLIPNHAIPEEFTKEHVRITFQDKFMSEMSDIDGILWGQQYTYPLEIKEKTAAFDNKIGYYFGIDVGPFVKLAFYAAKRGNLHSLFIVREIDNPTNRHLVNWWFITFDTLAQFASWVPVTGGRNMQGGGSSVIKVPKAEFRLLNRENLNTL